MGINIDFATDGRFDYIDAEISDKREYLQERSQEYIEEQVGKWLADQDEEPTEAEVEAFKQYLEEQTEEENEKELEAYRRKLQNQAIANVLVDRVLDAVEDMARLDESQRDDIIEYLAGDPYSKTSYVNAAKVEIGEFLLKFAEGMQQEPDEDEEE